MLRSVRELPSQNYCYCIHRPRALPARFASTMPKGQYERHPERASTSIPSIIDICQQIPDEAAAIAFLTTRGILTLPKETACFLCGYKGCRVKSKNTPKSLKCNKGNCGKSQSLLRSTIFAGSKMPLHKLLYLSVFWLFRSPSNVVNAQLHCSARTIADFYKIFRQMIAKIISSDNGLFWGMRGETLDEDLAIVMWREQNINNLWDAFLNDMKRLNEVKEITHWFDSKVDIAMGLPAIGNNAVQQVNASDAVQHIDDSVIETQQQHRKVREMAQQNSAEETKEPQEEKRQETSSLSFTQHFFASQNAATTAMVKEKRQETSSLSLTQCYLANQDAAATAMVEEVQQKKPKMLQQKKEKKRKKAQGQKRQYSSWLTIEDICAQSEEHDAPSPSRKRPRQLQSVPSFMDICGLIPTEDKAIEFLTMNDIFTQPKKIICSHCGYKGFRAKGKKTPKALKCNRCSKGTSLMRGTFFEGNKIQLQQILYMAVFWLSLSPASTVITQLRCSSATVTEFSDKFRRLINRYMEGQEGDNSVIMALQADRFDMARRLKPHIPKFARKDRSNEHVGVALWRERNVDNLWQAFILALRTVKQDVCVSGAETGNEQWVNEKSGKACCKYHLKEHMKQQLQLNIENAGKTAAAAAGRRVPVDAMASAEGQKTLMDCTSKQVSKNVS